MEFLWSPWRQQYVTSGQTSKPPGCVFCYFATSTAPEFDAEHFILHRGQHNFVLLNLYPYTSAHLMIVPYAHEAELAALSEQIESFRQQF